jgi:hypothetical protein
VLTTKLHCCCVIDFTNLFDGVSMYIMASDDGVSLYVMASDDGVFVRNGVK